MLTIVSITTWSVMCDTPGAGWAGMIVFTFHILLQRSILSSACHRCTADDLTPHRLPSSHLHCVYSQARGQVLSPHLNKHSAYIWWSNNWNISTLLTEFTETQLRLFWLILLRTAALWLLITGRSFLAFRMTQSHRCRGSQSLKALLTWCMVYHVSLQSIWNEGMWWT